MAASGVGLDAWCRAHLGAGTVEVFFTATSMSVVQGVLLADGRRVAVKHREASDRVLACAEAQRRAGAGGVDCPALLAGPVRDGEHWVSAEEWRPEGTPVLPPGAPARFARLLRSIVVSLDGLPPEHFAPAPPWIWYDHGATGRVWPPASSPRWDPHGDAADVPAWLVGLAATARERLLADPVPAVVGHSDLNGHNVKWQGDHRPLVHDWDSLAARPECVLAGVLAANHVEMPGAGAIAGITGTEVLLDEYENLRPFTPVERELAWAAGVAVSTYNAAFEYLHGGPGGVTRQLAEDGAERLRRAGC